MGTANAEGYAGLKLGSLKIDLDSVEDIDTFGFVAGSAKSGGGFEFEFNQTKGGGRGDLEVTTVGMYGALRTEGAGPYVKARFGLLFESAKVQGFSSASDSDVGTSFGFGFGIRGAEDGPAVEFEYTIIEQDADLVSIAFLF
jgi:hypothetical protein